MLEEPLVQDERKKVQIIAHRVCSRQGEIARIALEFP